MKKYRIYLDNCCLNRPFDDLSYDTVRLESEAILTIIDKCDDNEWEIFESDVLCDEIYRIKNIIKKEKVLSLYYSATINIELTKDIVNRASEISAYGIKTFDSLHLASAEYGNADIFLTTDKQLISAVKKSDVKVKVSNPAIWLMEVLYNDW